MNMTPSIIGTAVSLRITRALMFRSQREVLEHARFVRFTIFSIVGEFGKDNLLT